MKLFYNRGSAWKVADDQRILFRVGDVILLEDLAQQEEILKNLIKRGMNEISTYILTDAETIFTLNQGNTVYWPYYPDPMKIHTTRHNQSIRYKVKSSSHHPSARR